jgi:predicted unusual protein kinase regulating ubiquinone biosynthesis (AarF/ABC1/UbiB family)
VLKNGLFHADAHQGNVAVDRQGRLIWYDFGAVIECSSLRNNMAKLVQAVVMNDLHDITDLLITMNIIRATGPRSDIRQVLGILLQYIDDMDANSIHDMLSTKKTLQAKFKDVFQFDTNFTFMLRSIFAIEGMCRVLDPEFNYRSYMETCMGDLLPPMDFKPMMRDVVAVPRTVRNMSEVLMQMEKIQQDTRDDAQNMVMKAALWQLVFLTAVYVIFSA